MVPASPMLRWPGGSSLGGFSRVPPAPFLLSRFWRGKDLPWGCGDARMGAGAEVLVRCRAPALCWDQALVEGRGPCSWPAQFPRLPPAPGHEGTGSSRDQSPACTETCCPHQGLRLGLATRQVWPGTEEVPAALVGALGELRQFSIGWFKKRPKPAKPDVPEARQAGGRVWGCSGFALSCHLDPACPKAGTEPCLCQLCAQHHLHHHHQEPAAQYWKSQEGTLGYFRGDSGS